MMSTDGIFSLLNQRIGRVEWPEDETLPDYVSNLNLSNT